MDDNNLSFVRDGRGKGVFRVLTCSGEPFIRDLVKMIISGHLGSGYTVQVVDRAHTTHIRDLVESRHFDLIVPLVNNILVPTHAAKDRVFKAFEFLGNLKTQYGIA